ncbi:MauE/DoxX family redox-associated membrane protein [Marinicrinis lubricantis]|uniref:MauE/DoxX family redox-associated membrane protein n=1 Tax=Marinicrinis lubricantis TaxID=2086470 RepID=A0ABW1IQS5_9BACL
MIIFVFLLATIFMISAVSKIVSFQPFRKTLENLGFKGIHSVLLAALVIGMELIAAGTLYADKFRILGQTLCLLLLICFTGAALIARKRKQLVACNCFGISSSDEFLGKKTYYRVGVLFVLLCFTLFWDVHVQAAGWEEQLIFATASISIFLISILLPVVWRVMKESSS